MPNDDDGQEHMFKFISLKESGNKSATIEEVAAPKVLPDMTIMQVVD